MPGIPAISIFKRRGNAAPFPGNYLDRVNGLFGSSLVAYWPLDDTSGTLVRCVGSTPAYLNLVRNPGFEALSAITTTNSGWTKSGAGTLSTTTTAGEFHSGAQAAKMVGVCSLIQSVSVIAGQKYTLKFWTRGDGTKSLSYRVAQGDWGAWIISTTNTLVTGTNYVQITSIEFTAPGSFTNIYIEFDSPSAGTVYLDDVEVLPSVLSINYLNGKYGNVTLNQTGNGDGNASIYLNGVDASGINLAYYGALSNIFVGNTGGTLIIWGKPHTDILTDGSSHYLVKFKTDSTAANNYVDIFKDAANNKCGWQFKNQATDFLYATADITAAWYCLGITWSNGVINRYVNGVNIGTSDKAGAAWNIAFNCVALSIGSDVSALIGNIWKGNLQHCILGNIPLSDISMKYLGTVY